MLRKLAENLWVEERTQSFYGLEVGARMTVMRLADGSLFLHSPVTLDPRLCNELDALGLLIRDRPAARQSFERILAWDFDRVVIAHGEVLETGGPAALRAGYDWLLAA